MGLFHSAIAQELDVSEHTVKTTISKALKRLRTKLTDITVQSISFGKRQILSKEAVKSNKNYFLFQMYTYVLIVCLYYNGDLLVEK